MAPLDGTNYATPLPSPVEALSAEHARLLAIAVMLETDPEVRGRWDFDELGGETECGFVGCAIGWAHHRGLLAKYPCTVSAAIELGLDIHQVQSIFAMYRATGRHFYGKDLVWVTPDDVAQAIRAHLAGIYRALRASARATG